MPNFDATSYCRLCAELKPISKLINLDVDDEKRGEIDGKLTQLGVPVSEIFRGDFLPKTVCFVCINSLDTAVEFILNIGKAQGVLNDIILYRQIKKESSGTDEENCIYDLNDEVKSEENVVIKQETESKDTKTDLNVKIKVTKHQKRKKSQSLDAIPLAQLKLTWKDYSWMCSYCETQFPNIDELTLHSMQQHGCCNAYRCTDCNMRKLRLDSFLLHVKRHRKYLKLSCYKCHIRFSKPQETNIHKSLHINTQNVCSGCNTSFVCLEELSKHKNKYYIEKRIRSNPILEQLTEDNLTCILCKKTFKHKGGLNSHLLIHTERKRDHTCEKCGKCFLNKQNLAGHMLLHEDSRPHQCEICKMSFKTATQLRNHVGVHDNKKPFACDQCGRCFRLRKQLNSHVIIHTDLLPYVCTICNKGFRFRTILYQHLRQHTGVKPYSCKVCQRDFTNWPNYNKHMKRRHGMDMAKKKHTPEGLYPVDPSTGELVIQPETDKLVEWKKQMMAQRKPGRPKIQKPTD